MIRKTLLHPLWMPTVVLLLGSLAAVLLLWTGRIHEKNRNNDLMIDAIMDVQIHTSTFHLWFEEALAGDTNIDMKKAWEDHARAVTLCNTLLVGGESEHGWILQPLKDEDQRRHAEGILILLKRFEALALVRQQQPEKAGIGSVFDQSFDDIFGMILTRARELENSVQADLVRNHRKSDQLFAGIVLVWTFIVIIAAWGLLYRERRRKASEDALLVAHQKLLYQAEELKGHREHLTELVDERTKELTSSNRNLEFEIAQHEQTEAALKDSQKQLRQLPSMLLAAQEEERRKIARELHDELGQSLTLMKFQLRSVAKQLGEDQRGLKEECESSLQYMNTVIENVRRLSRDLRPTVLDDLGLTRALQWLGENFKKTHGIRIVMDVTDIDHFFSKEAQTNIYRIVQEALTNIMKHSGAENARVIIRRGRWSVAVFIEDDGKGFKKAEVATQGVEDRGVGLASMEERVNILGGSLSIWSGQGNGTHISISIPVVWTGRETKTQPNKLQSTN